MKRNKLIIILALSILATSCRSGWSCKKRYVSVNKEKHFNC
jgi:hypothetical protein